MAAKPFYSFFTTFLLFFVLQPFVIKSLKLESVQEFQQAQKGDIADDINQIKKYLKTYGYYPHDIKDELDNQFDDSLENALKTYQKYNYLNVTGKIDSDTVKAMMIPRCGVPDNHLVSNYTFPGDRWRKYDLTYRISNYVAESTPPLENAFRSWSRVSPFRFQRAAQGVRADINIGFFQRSHGDNNDFKPNEWAHAFYPEDGRLHFNVAWRWSSNPNANDVDVESIGVHELGHILGLDHSQYSSAVMYYAFPGGQFTKRALTNDDIAGLRALYGY